MVMALTWPSEQLLDCLNILKSDLFAIFSGRRISPCRQQRQLNWCQVRQLQRRHTCSPLQVFVQHDRADVRRQLDIRQAGDHRSDFSGPSATSGLRDLRVRNLDLNIASPVWPDLAKFRHFGKMFTVYFLFGKILSQLWQFFYSLFLIWQNVEPTLPNLLHYWANFHCC